MISSHPWASIGPVGAKLGKVVFVQEIGNPGVGFAQRGLGLLPQPGSHVALVLKWPGGLAEQADGLRGLAGDQCQVGPAFDDATAFGRGCEQRRPSIGQTQFGIKFIQFHDGDGVMERTRFKVLEGAGGLPETFPQNQAGNPALRFRGWAGPARPWRPGG